jgi:hypothetical protein
LATTLSKRLSKSTRPLPVWSMTSLRSASWRSPSLSRSRKGSRASTCAQAAS